MQKGEVSTGLLIITVFTLGIALAVVNGWNSFFVREQLSGKVESVGGRFKGIASETGGSVTQKASLGFKTEKYGKIFVNCNATQCFAVEKGDTITLSCYKELHIRGANEWECRWGE